jgi:phospholipid-binding lipoprotein MlaA
MRWLREIAGLCASAVCSAAFIGCAAQGARPDTDPLEAMNRKVFWFNDKVDVYALEPVATGWDKIAPDQVKQSLANFFQNLRFPIVTLNDLLQGKLVPAASDVGRFAVNTTVGVLGFFDPATGWGLEAHNEDFGQTLGWWGLPPGPYLVLPLLGPSNPRDAVGTVTDSFAAVYPWFIDIVYTASARGVDIINTRARFLQEVRQAKEASVDYYEFVRNTYEQHRKALINDQAGMTEQEQEDLYNIDTNGGNDHDKDHPAN